MPDQGSARVLVSGLGPLTRFGAGLDELDGGVTEASFTQQRKGGPAPVATVGLIPAFDIQDFVETRHTYLDPHTKCCLAAAALALDNAAVVADEVDPLRCGLSLGTMFANIETQGVFQHLIDQKGARLASPILFAHSYPNATASLMAIEFALRGYSQNFCGGRLCGAQAVESAVLALRSGGADLVLAGGADVPPRDVLDRLHGAAGEGGPAPSQGAGFMVLETQDSVERREGYAFCELCSVACEGAGGEGPDELAEALRRAVGRVLDEAGLWEGEVGVLAVGSHPREKVAHEAKQIFLAPYSQVPRCELRSAVGETFGAAFPLEITWAALIVSSGSLPSKVTFQGTRRGVEFWLERRQEPLMGEAGLVVDCEPGLAAAALVRAL